MVPGESTIALLSDTGAGSFVVQPFMDDILDRQSKTFFGYGNLVLCLIIVIYWSMIFSSKCCTAMCTNVVPKL